MIPLRVDSYLDLLARESEYTNLLSAARQLHENQLIFSELVPWYLAQHCTVGRIMDGKLVILVDNGAVASKLKQLTPSLILKLQMRGLKVTAFQILVQAHYSERNDRFSMKHGDIGNKPKLSLTGKNCLNRLTETLPECELRCAVQSFLKNYPND